MTVRDPRGPADTVIPLRPAHPALQQSGAPSGGPRVARFRPLQLPEIQAALLQAARRTGFERGHRRGLRVGLLVGVLLGCGLALLGAAGLLVLLAL